MARFVAPVLLLSLAGFAVAGPEDHAELLASPGLLDTRSALDYGFWVQLRAAANQRDTFPAVSARTTVGASIPRSRIFFNYDHFRNGAAEPVRARISGEFAPDTGALNLRDATVSLGVFEGVRIVAGQFVAPWMMEPSIEDNRMLFATHSVVGEAFDPGLSQGIVLDIRADDLPNFLLSITDGFGSGNTDPGDEFSDVAITGRANLFFDTPDVGNANVLWGDYFLVDDPNFAIGFPGSDFGAVVGAAAMYQTGGNTAAGIGGVTIERDHVGVTIDGRIGGDGVVAMGSLVFVNTSVPQGDSNDVGANFQIGYFIDTQWQLIGGVDAIFPDDNLVPGAESFIAFRLGFNHFFMPGSHAAKVTVQFSIFDDAVTSGAIPAVGGGQGIFGNGSANDLILLNETGSPQVSGLVQLQIEAR